MTNNDYFPWDEIPDSNVFPTMTGRFAFSKLEDGQSSNGKRMFRGQFTCIEPAQYAGMAHFENFVTGTEENPMGIVAGTMGSRSLKSAIAKAQIAQNASITQICQLVTASQPQLMLSIVHQVEQGGDYAGQERNRITAYHKIGEREVKIAPKPGVMGSAGPGAASGAIPQMPSVPQGQAMPQPVQQPVQQPQMPTQPAPQQPMASYSPQAVQQPVMQPAQPAAPVQQQAPPAPQMAATPGEASIPCQICAQKGNPASLVPVSQFQNHVARHQQDPNWNGIG